MFMLQVDLNVRPPFPPVQCVAAVAAVPGRWLQNPRAIEQLQSGGRFNSSLQFPGKYPSCTLESLISTSPHVTESLYWGVIREPNLHRIRQINYRAHLGNKMFWAELHPTSHSATYHNKTLLTVFDGSACIHLGINIWLADDPPHGLHYADCRPGPAAAPPNCWYLGLVKCSAHTAPGWTKRYNVYKIWKHIKDKTAVRCFIYIQIKHKLRLLMGLF